MLGKIQIFERLGEEKWRQAVGQLLPVQADAGSLSLCEGQLSVVTFDDIYHLVFYRSYLC